MSKTPVINILMIDDDEGDTLMTRESFDELGLAHNFFEVHDAKEAIAYMDKGGVHENAVTPDVVLLDINMPQTDGYEVLAWIRSHEEYKTTPVIMFSTSETPEDVLRSHEHGANSYITKPSTLSDYEEVVKIIGEFWLKTAKLPSVSS